MNIALVVRRIVRGAHQSGSKLRALQTLRVIVAVLCVAGAWPGFSQSTPIYAWTNLAGLPGTSGTNDGRGRAARFYHPSGVAVDNAGNIFVAEIRNHMIRKLTPTGKVTTVAGGPGDRGTNRITDPTVLQFGPDGEPLDDPEASGTNDGPGRAARFNGPTSLAVDRSGDVFVADCYNATIRKMTAGGVVTTVAGSAEKPGDADGTGSAARFAWPSGVAVDSTGNVFVADYLNHTVRKVTPEGMVTTLAGSPGNLGSADGTGSEARFNCPAGVAVDSTGNVFVADSFNHTIRKVSPAGLVTTLAGNASIMGPIGPVGGYADGKGSAARFSGPSGVAVDHSGNVFVADGGNSAIRKVNPAGKVTTIGGAAGVAGWADGIGSSAHFRSPGGIAVDSAGNLYVADTGNNRITKGTPIRP